MSDKAPTSIEIWDIDDIHPYEMNAKIHTPEQVKTLVESIGNFGWTSPIVVDKDGIIIAGHGRRLAAIEIGSKKIPIICRRDLNKGQADALRIADNKVSSVEYDEAMMGAEIRRIMDESEITEDVFKDIGFTDHELQLVDFDTLGDMDMDAFESDILGAVTDQSEENKKREEGIDNDLSPLSKVLGFSKITIEQSRRVKVFMHRAELSTGKEGAEAFMDFIDRYNQEEGKDHE